MARPRLGYKQQARREGEMCLGGLTSLVGPSGAHVRRDSQSALRATAQLNQRRESMRQRARRGPVFSLISFLPRALRGRGSHADCDGLRGESSPVIISERWVTITRSLLWSCLAPSARRGEPVFLRSSCISRLDAVFAASSTLERRMLQHLACYCLSASPSNETHSRKRNLDDENLWRRSIGAPRSIALVVCY